MTHSWGKLFTLGSTDGSSILSVIPLDTTIIPPPYPKSIKTINTSIGQDCNLNDDRTSIHAIQDSIYIICSRASQPSSKKTISSLQLYAYHGVDVQYLGSISAKTNQDGEPIIYQVVPVPPSSGSPKPSPWAYVFSSRNSVFSLHFSSNVDGGNIGKPSHIYGRSAITVDQDNTDSLNITMLQAPIAFQSQGAPVTLIVSIAILVLVLAVIARFACGCLGKWNRSNGSRNRVGNGASTIPRGASAGGSLFNSLPGEQIPLHRSLTSTTTQHRSTLPAVNRTMYGEDASDALPKYTPRDTGHTVTVPPLAAQIPLPEPPSYSTAVAIEDDSPVAADISMEFPGDETRTTTSIEAPGSITTLVSPVDYPQDAVGSANPEGLQIAAEEDRRALISAAIPDSPMADEVALGHATSRTLATAIRTANSHLADVSGESITEDLRRC
ncbi:hypothetical protein BGZ99_002923 [Dissophora globulifera]|uniref:Uncharacterized protein n=1 Tax=Dissophora globulifera TaxID=979702 RepID=A0A9P6RMN6_9FUNG|nr:hypothetical protein BGZ99_002923 [Dissophora globulifera]